MNRIFYPLLIMLGAGLMLMPLSIPLLKSNAPYSVINTNWDGISRFGRLLYSTGDIKPIIEPYDSARIIDSKGVLIVIGPDLPFLPEEVNTLKKFLENGGMLILADDIGTGNELLKSLGLKIRISKKALLSLTYSKSSEFPISNNVLPPYTGPVVMDRPSILLHTNNARIILYSSNASLFNGNFGVFPIAAEMEYGKGKVIVFSDPDIFINSLFTKNKLFLKSLVENLPERTFLIDEAHHKDFNPYITGSIVIRRTVNRNTAFYYVILIAILGLAIESKVLNRAIGFVMYIIYSSSSKNESNESLEEIIERLEKKGFNRDKLRILLREIETGSKLGDVYER